MIDMDNKTIQHYLLKTITLIETDATMLYIEFMDGTNLCVEIDSVYHRLDIGGRHIAPHKESK
jgi:hypothetical protein